MKRLRNLMLALIMVPCVLLLTACGGSDPFAETASVNTEGNYTTTTKAELNEYLGTTAGYVENEKTVMDGYRITITGEEEGVSLEANGVFLFGETFADTQIALKSVSTYEGQEGGAYIYIVDGVMYMSMEAPGTSVKYKMPLEGDDFENVNETFMGDTPNVAQLIEGIVENDDITVRVAVEGSTKKYEITALNEFEEEVITYLVFENDVLQGVSVEMEIEGINALVAIQPYSGSIDFPSFSDYAEMPAEF